MLTGLGEFPKMPSGIVETIAKLCEVQHTVAKAVQEASTALESILAIKYKNQDWDKRRRDFRLVSKLAEKHTSILGFIEEYLLDPIYHSELNTPDDNDKVTVITVHSAKGTEREVCYVVNVSPGAYPSSKAIGSPEEIEEERRVLYVALTRAKDELIVTRNGYRLWATLGNAPKETINADDETAMYFLDSIPDGLLDENIHQRSTFVQAPVISQVNQPSFGGIVIG